MNNRSSNRRQTLLVAPELQRRIIFHVSFYPLLTLLVAAVSVAIFSGRLTEEAARIPAELPSLGIFLVSMLTFIVVFGLLLIRQALIFSNKVAGPSYRICKSLEEVRAGNFDLRIQLRKGDFNTEISNEINRLLDWRTQQLSERGSGKTAQQVRSQPSHAGTAPASH